MDNDDGAGTDDDAFIALDGVLFPFGVVAADNGIGALRNPFKFPARAPSILICSGVSPCSGLGALRNPLRFPARAPEGWRLFTK